MNIQFRINGVLIANFASDVAIQGADEMLDVVVIDRLACLRMSPSEGILI